jgi:hypothetical protein
LTADYIRNTGNPNAKVYFNGTNCVLSNTNPEEEKKKKEEASQNQTKKDAE